MDLMVVHGQRRYDYTYTIYGYNLIFILCYQMIGYGPENSNFALELTYNYGINGYEFGNDLQYIAFASPQILQRAVKFGCTIINSNEICGPDNYKYKIIPPIAGRAEVFVAVGLRCANLDKALGYWINIIGMTIFATPPGLETLCRSACVGFNDSQTYLQLIEVDDGKAVDHALSSGRIAFACKDKSVPSIFAAITVVGETVQVPPLTLPTPGKADVVVTILRDRDDYEICFVEDIAFYDLATPKYDVIDFTDRASRGGDGAPPPVGDKIAHIEEIKDITSQDELDSALSHGKSLNKLVVVYFGASWCKNCKKITPTVEKLVSENASKVICVAVDIAACEEFAVEHDVSNVPRFFVYRDGEKVEDYLGSADDKIAYLFTKNK